MLASKKIDWANWNERGNKNINGLNLFRFDIASRYALSHIIHYNGPASSIHKNAGMCVLARVEVTCVSYMELRTHISSLMRPITENRTSAMLLLDDMVIVQRVAKLHTWEPHLIFVVELF